MPVTVVVWNVETFGDTWNAARGAAYVPMCNFMAETLYAVSADVFIMMELRRRGAAYLPTLAASLVTRSGAADVWNYDYIPGSVLAGHAYPIVNPAHLGFTKQGHGEGYAVLWRNRPAEFGVFGTRLVLSRHPVGGQSRIGLVFRGRSANPNAPNPVWFTAPNFDPANPPVPWLRLDFPEPNPIHAGDVRWDLARRPCCVVLNLNRPHVGPAQRLLPIVVHHATNNPSFSTPWSVQSAAYSAQLYQVDNTALGVVTMVTVAQAIAAGDYNIDHNVPTKWQYGAYAYFTSGFAAGGANLPSTWVNSATPMRNRTAVRLNHRDRNRTPITGVNVNDYRWLAIDNLFIRNLNTVTPPSGYRGPVYNVLSGLLQNGFLVNSAAKRQVIRSFRAAIITALGAALPGGGFVNYRFINPANGTPCSARKRRRDGSYVYSGEVIGNLLNYAAYMNDLNNGYFSTARRAAEFYFNSISDHLPLVYRFTV